MSAARPVPGRRRAWRSSPGPDRRLRRHRPGRRSRPARARRGGGSARRPPPGRRRGASRRARRGARGAPLARARRPPRRRCRARRREPRRAAGPSGVRGARRAGRPLSEIELAYRLADDTDRRGDRHERQDHGHRPRRRDARRVGCVGRGAAGNIGYPLVEAVRRPRTRGRRRRGLLVPAGPHRGVPAIGGHVAEPRRGPPRLARGPRPTTSARQGPDLGEPGDGRRRRRQRRGPGGRRGGHATPADACVTFGSPAGDYHIDGERLVGPDGARAGVGRRPVAGPAARRGERPRALATALAAGGVGRGLPGGATRRRPLAPPRRARRPTSAASGTTTTRRRRRPRPSPRRSPASRSPCSSPGGATRASTSGRSGGAPTAGGARRVRAVVAIGEAAAEVAAAFDGYTVVSADSMDAAVTEASRLAQPGDAVLLSPGCASFDWYASYEERGQDFARAVQASACARPAARRLGRRRADDGEERAGRPAAGSACRRARLRRCCASSRAAPAPGRRPARPGPSPPRWPVARTRSGWARSPRRSPASAS